MRLITMRKKIGTLIENEGEAKRKDSGRGEDREDSIYVMDRFELQYSTVQYSTIQ